MKYLPKYIHKDYSSVSFPYWWAHSFPSINQPKCHTAVMWRLQLTESINLNVHITSIVYTHPTPLSESGGEDILLLQLLLVHCQHCLLESKHSTVVRLNLSGLLLQEKDTEHCKPAGKTMSYLHHDDVQIKHTTRANPQRGMVSGKQDCIQREGSSHVSFTKMLDQMKQICYIQCYVSITKSFVTTQLPH